MRRILLCLIATALGAITGSLAPTLLETPAPDPTTLRIGERLSVEGTGFAGTRLELFDEVGAISISALEITDDAVSIRTPYLLQSPHRLVFTRDAGWSSVSTSLSFDLSYESIFEGTQVTSTTRTPPWLLIVGALLLVVPAHRLMFGTRFLGAAAFTVVLGPAGAFTAALIATVIAVAGPHLADIPRSRALTAAAAGGAAFTGFLLLTGVGANGESSDVCANPDSARCRGYALAQLITDGRMDVAMAQLAAIPATESGLCHDLGHWAGRYAVEQVAVEQLYDGVSPHCQWGYLHGVAERVAQVADDEAWERFVPQCNTLDAQDSMLAFCGHGIGHATFRRHIKMDAALADCARLIGVARGSCQSASFMEWTSRWVDTRHSTRSTPYRPDLETPAEYCAEVRDDLVEVCYYDIWNGTSLFYDLEFARSLAGSCASVPAAHRDRCAEGYAMGLASTTRSTVDVPLCDVTGSRDGCRLGMATALVAVFAAEGRDPFDICTELPFPGCREHVASRIEKDGGSLVFGSTS